MSVMTVMSVTHPEFQWLRRDAQEERSVIVSVIRKILEARTNDAVTLMTLTPPLFLVAVPKLTVSDLQEVRREVDRLLQADAPVADSLARQHPSPPRDFWGWTNAPA
jgi:hypothetical protein